LQRIRARNLRAQPLCVCCLKVGRIKGATQVDHRIPLFKGGTDTDDNRQNLCDECHLAKSIVERGDRLRLGCAITGVPLDPTHPWAIETGPTVAPQHSHETKKE
jgi:5-methylcytosine-specific restriction enzyme A